MEIKAKTLKSWSPEKHMFFQDLGMLYTEAGRNASIAARLSQEVLRDNWAAIGPLRTTLCQPASCQLLMEDEEADNFTTSLWPSMAMTQQPILW
jgi:hypothetical protein